MSISSLSFDDSVRDIDNEKDALGSAFIDILKSIVVRQHVSVPTH